MKWYDEKNCLVNLSNSVRKHYGLACYHESLPFADEILSKNEGKKVCFLLLDGFGRVIQDLYASYVPTILSGVPHVITSVFPPTTVAATTALLCGKYPIETGWLGWTECFPFEEESVEMFSSRRSFSKESSKVPTYQACPYTSIFTDLKEKFTKI